MKHSELSEGPAIPLPAEVNPSSDTSPDNSTTTTTTITTTSTNEMQRLTSRVEYTQALMPDGTVVMEGITKNCPICKGMRPVVNNLIRKYPDARFYLYNVDEAEDIAQELGARNVPNFTIFKDGMLEDGVTGFKPKELEKLIREAYDGHVEEKIKVY